MPKPSTPGFGATMEIPIPKSANKLDQSMLRRSPMRETIHPPGMSPIRMPTTSIDATSPATDKSAPSRLAIAGRTGISADSPAEKSKVGR
jgi:hypothetical protein